MKKMNRVLDRSIFWVAALVLAVSLSQRVSAAVEGYLDVADCHHIAGWEWDSNAPNTVQELVLRIYDSQDPYSLPAIVYANQFRADLLAAGKGNGIHAFDVPFPSVIQDQQSHAVHAYDAKTQQELSNSPMTVNCSSKPVSYTCPDGLLCSGAPVTGTPNQLVCGGDLQMWSCSSAGWKPTGSGCSCPGFCPDGVLCDGRFVMGTVGQDVCGSDLQIWTCSAASRWEATGSACVCAESQTH